MLKKELEMLSGKIYNYDDCVLIFVDIIKERGDLEAFSNYIQQVNKEDKKKYEYSNPLKETEVNISFKDWIRSRHEHANKH